MKPIKFTSTSFDRETLINPECVTDVIETDDGTAIYNQDLKLAVVKESVEEVRKRLTTSSEPCGIRRLLDSDIPEFKDIQFIPENVDEYLNSHKEVLAFDFYDQICNDRVVRYFESEEDLEKWIAAYPFHRGCIHVYHKNWIPYTGQAITIPPDTVIADADKILCSMSWDVFSKMTPEESRDEWYRAEGIGPYRIENDEYSRQMNEWCRELCEKNAKKKGYDSTEEYLANRKCDHEAMMTSVVHPEDIDENKVVELKFNDDGFEARLIDDK